MFGGRQALYIYIHIYVYIYVYTYTYILMYIYRYVDLQLHKGSWLVTSDSLSLSLPPASAMALYGGHLSFGQWGEVLTIGERRRLIQHLAVIQTLNPKP